MNRILKFVATAVAGFLCLCASGRSAHADSLWGYVCGVRETLIKGQESLDVDLSPSALNCNMSIGTITFVPTGASGDCSAYAIPQEKLTAIANNLTIAEMHSARVNIVGVVRDISPTLYCGTAYAITGYK
jgi:hypothetical protein